jgi:hypothetical protein
MLGSGIVNKQRQVRKAVKNGYLFEQRLPTATVQRMLAWKSPRNTVVIAASLIAGYVRLDTVLYWDRGMYHLGYDLMVVDSPLNPEWICYESLPDEVRYNAWNLEREMFQILDRAVEQFGLSYTECRFPTVDPNLLKPKTTAREACDAPVSDASRKEVAQHP